MFIKAGGNTRIYCCLNWRNDGRPLDLGAHIFIQTMTIKSQVFVRNLESQMRIQLGEIYVIRLRGRQGDLNGQTVKRQQTDYRI